MNNAETLQQYNTRLNENNSGLNDILETINNLPNRSGGTTDYENLENKPKINNVELTGNKTLDELGIQVKGDYTTINDVENYIKEHKDELKGADGKDGYTPIKGVDYFDGKDGVNGVDGEDGYSPTAKVETTSTGATITITDKNGTTTTNIANGKDGVDGAKGEKGDTYTLTDADKQEIANIITDDGIPVYWKEHLDTKIQTIKDLQAIGGKDCFSFVFMTDIHFPTNLGKRSPILAKKIMDECNIKFALNGGDNNTRGCYETKKQILAENKKIEEMFLPIRDRLLQVEGNHDGSYATTNGVTYAKQFTENEMYEEYYRKVGLVGDVRFSEDDNAYYIDDNVNKVRYIGLNSMNVPNGVNDVNEDGTAKNCKFRKYQFLQSQYDFLVNEALVTGLTDNWSVVVFGHSGIYNAGDYAVMVDVLSAYKNKTTCVTEYVGTENGGVAYTNIAEPNSTEWQDGYRISSSGITAQSGKSVCNRIYITAGDIIRIKGTNFVAVEDRYKMTSGGGGNLNYISALPDNYLDYNLTEDGIHEFTIKQVTQGDNPYVQFSFDTPTDASQIIITKNEELVEAEHGYDYVYVNANFTNAKGEFIAYFHGHEHQDAVYTRDSIKDIATRCDSKQENNETLNAERVKDTITEQSFDVYTINKATKTINATKIGAGSDKEIKY